MCLVSHDGRLFPWPAGSATGIGSMPGTNPAEAMKVVLGELPDLPHLPELPARGPGADMIGRTAALLVDLPVQTTAGGWRLAARPGRDQRRAAGLLSADLDAMEEAAGAFDGTFKIQACGPWTLAATLGLSRSAEPALADTGAVADLIASLAEGVAGHAAQVRRRLPGATLLVQIDEPSLPAVLAGLVPTASGLNRIAAVDEPVACDALRRVLSAVGAPTVLHCCARGVPFSCITQSGAAAVAFDLDLLTRRDDDAIGEAVEAGLGLFAGAVRIEPAASDEQAALRGARGVVGLWQRIGLPPAGLAGQVVVTPACGMAAAPAELATSVLGRCRAAARMAPELIEEGIQ
jgi:Cobalamin-independent synthase, Catalytic domain